MTPEASRNIDFVGHTDNAGRGDGVQVMVSRGHAYIGTRVSRGVNVTDVRDPRNPRPSISCRSTRTPGACISKRPRTSCSSSRSST